MPIVPHAQVVKDLEKALAAPITSLDTSRLEQNTVLLWTAVKARIDYPTARYLVYSDSDQGDYGQLATILDAEQAEVLTEEQLDYLTDEYDVYMYDNLRSDADAYLADDVEKPGRGHVWDNLHIDIDKVLADPPKTVPTQPSLTIPDDVWRKAGREGEDEFDDGDEQSRLTTTIVINGVSFHLDAFEVRDVAGDQVAPQGDEDLGSIANAVGADGQFETVTIMGREYVLVATPFC